MRDAFINNRHAFIVRTHGMPGGTRGRCKACRHGHHSYSFCNTLTPNLSDKSDFAIPMIYRTLRCDNVDTAMFCNDNNLNFAMIKWCFVVLSLQNYAIK